MIPFRAQLILWRMIIILRQSFSSSNMILSTFSLNLSTKCHVKTMFINNCMVMENHTLFKHKFSNWVWCNTMTPFNYIIFAEPIFTQYLILQLAKKKWYFRECALIPTVNSMEDQNSSLRNNLSNIEIGWHSHWWKAGSLPLCLAEKSKPLYSRTT